MSQTIHSFSIIYEQDPDSGYIAFAPGLPGCHTQGDTLEEAETNMKEAIALYLESLRDHNEQLPLQPRILQGNIEVAVTT